MSPRPRVRVAVVDAYGTVLNDYRDRAIGTAAPERPWAVYLAGPVSYTHLTLPTIPLV